MEFTALSRINGAQNAGIYSIFMGWWCTLHGPGAFLHIWPIPLEPPNGHTRETGTIWQIGVLTAEWSIFGLRFCEKLGPLLCEQWSVNFVKLQYEQNLDDDNDRRGQSETL